MGSGSEGCGLMSRIRLKLRRKRKGKKQNGQRNLQPWPLAGEKTEEKGDRQLGTRNSQLDVGKQPLTTIHETPVPVTESSSVPSTLRGTCDCSAKLPQGQAENDVRESTERDSDLEESRSVTNTTVSDLTSDHSNEEATGSPKPDPAVRGDGIYLTALEYPALSLPEADKQSRYERLRSSLGTITCSFEPVSVATLRALLPESKEHLRTDLQGLRSLLGVPNDDSSALTLSDVGFLDFLQDRSRAGDRFYVDTDGIHNDMLERSFKIMAQELQQDICKLKMPGTLVSDLAPGKVEEHVSPHLSYCCRRWIDHLVSIADSPAKQALLRDHGPVHAFLLTKFPEWLEALSLLGQAPIAFAAVNRLLPLLDHRKSPQLSSLLQDANRFVLSNRWVIETAPLQIYCSGLVFSPKKSLIRKQFSHQIPAWISTTPPVEEDWNPALFELTGYADSNEIVYTASGVHTEVGKIYPQPGRRACAYHDVSYKWALWDIDMGPVTKGLDDTKSIKFSPDGNFSLFETKKGALQFWDGSAAKKLVEFQSSQVASVRFSDDSHFVGLLAAFSPTSPASSASSGTDRSRLVRILDASNRLKEIKMKPIDPEHCSFHFSPEGFGINNHFAYALGSNRKMDAQRRCAMYIWDLNTGEIVSKEENNSTRDVLLSPSGDWFAHITFPSSLGVFQMAFWDVATKTNKYRTSIVNEGDFRPWAVSPNGLYVATKDDNKSRPVISIINTQTWQQVDQDVRSLNVSDFAISNTGVLVESTRGSHTDTRLDFWHVSGSHLAQVNVADAGESVSFRAFSPDLSPADLSVPKLPLRSANQTPGGGTLESLDVLGRWVTVGLSKLVWMPVNFREKFSTSANRVFLYNQMSGSVGMLELDLGKAPLPSTYGA